MRESPYNSALVLETLPVATRTANTTVDGTGIDLGANSGVSYRTAMVVIHGGTITDGTHTFEVQESSDNTTYTAVAAADLQGTEPSLAAANDNELHEVGYIGSKEYIRVSVTTSGATSGGTFGASVVLLEPSDTPQR